MAMIINNQTIKIIQFLTFLLTGYSLFSANKYNIKKYMPAVIFASLLMAIVFQLA